MSIFDNPEGRISSVRDALLVRVALAGLLLVIGVLASPGLLKASEGEKSASVGLGYLGVARLETNLHAPALEVSAAWFLTDFVVTEAMLMLGVAPTQGSATAVFGGEVSLRLLLDATQWIPSIGPVVGYVGQAGGPDSFHGGLNIGLSACIDHRSHRSWSMGVCGEITAFPFGQTLEATYLAVYRLTGFFPEFFSK